MLSKGAGRSQCICLWWSLRFHCRCPAPQFCPNTRWKGFLSVMRFNINDAPFPSFRVDHPSRETGSWTCECYREWVLKNCIKKRFSGCPYHRSSPCFPPRLSGGYQHRCGRSAKEPHQSLHVLRYRGQEELLTHEFQSPQTQARQPDLILKFCE